MLSNDYVQNAISAVLRYVYRKTMITLVDSETESTPCEE